MIASDDEKGEGEGEDKKLLHVSNVTLVSAENQAKDQRNKPII